MPALHLIQNQSDPKLLPKQEKPAFLGGDLLAYRVAGDPPYSGRIILVFRPDHAAKGVTTSCDGWAMEKKIVFDEHQP